MTKLVGSIALAALTVALPTVSALAKDGTPIEASITAVFTRTLNSTNAAYCGTAILPAAVAANGAGSSSVGALTFELQKTLASPGAMQGCATLRSPNGDALYANYGGTISGPNGEGTLTFTGGTGRFEGATGTATFKGIFVGLYPTITVFGGGAIPSIHGIAIYSVEGIVYLEKEKGDLDHRRQ